MHCGKTDVPLTHDGYLDRHYRADHRINIDPGNQLCYGSAMGGGHLRPGEPCWSHGPDDPNCRAVAVRCLRSVREHDPALQSDRKRPARARLNEPWKQPEKPDAGHHKFP
jgi:hypothetical protein